MSLREYQRKRDFSRTAEPTPKEAKSKSGSLFVIQKHDASRLHYDFRLELGGTLKSWAVPKGVPFAKGDKRLAVHVEDHPLDYAGFEGVIPQGQYGGGTVMVWDTGTWECLGGDPARDLEEGKLHLALHGRKLDGEWTLIRIRRGESGNEWLLLKSGESITPVSKSADDQSVVSGRTMKQIAGDRDAEWQSNRASTAKPTLKERIRRKLQPVADDPAGSPTHSENPATQAKTNASAKRVATKPSTRPAKPVPSAKPKFIEPMKAKLADSPPAKGDWIYELKFDGFRALAMLGGGEVELMSRNAKDLAHKFPEIAGAVAAFPAASAMLDGEIVALDEDGRSAFQLLQAYDTGERRPPLCYYVFDLLHLDGRDLRALALHERKALLEPLLAEAGEPLRFSADIVGDPVQLLTEVKSRGLEGLIGKLRGSPYESGRRTGAWIKLKCVNEQEFVVGGYTPPQGTRPHFGALLVGYYEQERLRFAGKVGTGFNDAVLRSLWEQFQPLRREDCPFPDLPEKHAGEWVQNITPAIMRRCTWVEPRLVCQVKYTEWTRDGKLRHPVFLGLRQDKSAADVVRER